MTRMTKAAVPGLLVSNRKGTSGQSGQEAVGDPLRSRSSCGLSAMRGAADANGCGRRAAGKGSSTGRSSSPLWLKEPNPHSRPHQRVRPLSRVSVMRSRRLEFPHQHLGTLTWNRIARVTATHKGWYIPGAGTHFGRAFKGLGEMVPVRAPLSQRSRNMRGKQAPRAPAKCAPAN